MFGYSPCLWSAMRKAEMEVNCFTKSLKYSKLSVCWADCYLYKFAIFLLTSSQIYNKLNKTWKLNSDLKKCLGRRNNWKYRSEIKKTLGINKVSVFMHLFIWRQIELKPFWIFSHLNILQNYSYELTWHLQLSGLHSWGNKRCNVTLT